MGQTHDINHFLSYRLKDECWTCQDFEQSLRTSSYQVDGLEHSVTSSYVAVAARATICPPAVSAVRQPSRTKLEMVPWTRLMYPCVPIKEDKL